MNRARLTPALRPLGLGVAGFVVATLALLPGEEAVDHPRPVGYGEVLLEAHDCWTGPAPADARGVVPGHVVVTVDGRTRYAGERTTSEALEQVFGGVDHGLTVHGFCR